MQLRFVIILLFIVCSFYQINAQIVTDTTSDGLYEAWLDSVILTYQSKVPTDSLQVDSIANKTTEQKPGKKTGAEKIADVAPDITEVFSPKKILWSLIFILIGHFFIKTIAGALEIWAEKSAKRRVTLKGVIPIIRIFGWLLIVYIVVEGIIAPPHETLIAFFASIGVAIGFASQDILKNIFGGIIILLDRPFNVGDKIEAGNTYGEVVEIGLRSTRILTADDSIVSFPNGELMNQSVSNSNTGETNCLVVAEIFLPISIDTEKIRIVATEAAKVSKFIYLNKPITVLFFNELKDRKPYFKMRLKAYVMDIRYEFAFKSDMTEIVIRELLKEKLISEADY